MFPGGAAARRPTRGGQTRLAWPPARKWGKLFNNLEFTPRRSIMNGAQKPRNIRQESRRVLRTQYKHGEYCGLNQYEINGQRSIKKQHLSMIFSLSSLKCHQWIYDISEPAQPVQIQGWRGTNSIAIKEMFLFKGTSVFCLYSMRLTFLQNRAYSWNRAAFIVV